MNSKSSHTKKGLHHRSSKSWPSLLDISIHHHLPSLPEKTRPRSNTVHNLYFDTKQSSKTKNKNDGTRMSREKRASSREDCLTDFTLPTVLLPKKGSKNLKSNPDRILVAMRRRTQGEESEKFKTEKTMHNKTIKSLQTSYTNEIKSLRNQYEQVVEEFENYRKVNEKL